jgi:tetratricopeptide (TPR) repeat protein
MGVHFDRGRALFALKRYADAIAEYQQELAEEPNCCASQANIAAALINLGRTDEARRNVEQTLAMAPNYAYAHYLRSFIESNTGLNSVALQAIAEAIRLDQSALNFTRRATLLRLQNRHAECLAACEEALARDARFQPALLLQARALQSLDRPDEAAEVLRLALALNPEDPDAHEALGSVALATGDPAEALDALREARRIDPIQHHDREKILDAYARRMWPFRSIDLALKRYARLSPFTRWVLEAAALTVLIATLIATAPNMHVTSPSATLGFLAASNVLLFVSLARHYPQTIIRLTKRRELDLRWWQVIGECMFALIVLLSAHVCISLFAMLLSIMPGVAYWVFAMGLGTRQPWARRRRHGARVRSDADILPATIVFLLIVLLFGAVRFAAYLAGGEIVRASLTWLGALAVAGGAAWLISWYDRRSTALPPKTNAPSTNA